MAARKVFKVRATAKGFGGVPPARRRVGEVFQMPAGKDGKLPKAGWYLPVSDSTPEGRPERQAKPAAQQFEKVDGDIRPVDRRNSVDAFKGAEPDLSYLDKVDALKGGEANEDADSGDDLT